MKAKFILCCCLLVLMSAFVFADSVTIRPDGQGNYKQWRHVNCPSGNGEWQCVDEVSADTSDYLRNGGDNRKETFDFEDTSLTTETINSVTIYYYAMRHNKNANRCFVPMIRESGTNYIETNQICVGNSWSLESKTYTTNPATGSAWTVSEVNGLEAGMMSENPDGGARVAQVYAVVDYTPSAVCGNNIIEGSEVCDGIALSGESCTSQGFDGGSLACLGDCTGYDTSACYANSCSDTDGGNVANVAGTTSGDFEGSAYSSNDVCIDSDSLTEYFCSGDLEQSTAVDCGTDVVVDVCQSGDVYTNTTDYFCASGACGVSENNLALKESCNFGCNAGACLPDPCGNGLIDAGEACDGANLNGQTCSSQGFDGGSLSCQSDCQAFVTSACYTNTCSDTDGSNIFTQGTTSGDFEGSPYSNNDVCQDADSVNEYTCVGDLEQVTNHNCGTDTSVNVCVSGDVYVNITDFGCSSGACTVTESLVLNETCTHGCLSGACLPPADSCSDTDGGNVPQTAGTTSGFSGGSAYSNNDVCADADSVTEYFCSGTQEQSQTRNCGTDEYVSACVGVNATTDFIDYFCLSGECDSTQTQISNVDCTANDGSSTFCVDTFLFLNQTISNCIGSGICNSVNNQTMIQNCTSGCSNGACN